jgi:DNA-binding response OmpR family regulator
MMDATVLIPPRALILCADGRLSRLLETELSYLGVAARATESLPAADPPSVVELCLLVADGDEFSAADCEKLAEACGCPLLVFGRKETVLPPERGVFLRRPFALDRFEDTARSLLSPAAAPLWAMAHIPHRPEPPAETDTPPTMTWENGVLTVQGSPVPLTPAEAAILDRLYVHRGEVVSREALFSLLGGGGNSVEVYVCKLRAKIEKPLGRRMIHTVRGVGYRLESGI